MKEKKDHESLRGWESMGGVVQEKEREVIYFNYKNKGKISKRWDFPHQLRTSRESPHA